MTRVRPSTPRSSSWRCGSTPRRACRRSSCGSTPSATRACRPAYIETLRAYFAPHAASLPELEQTRLVTSPLRLLDSKEPVMQPLIAAAPSIADHLCDACAEHFAGVRAHLDAMGVAYRLEPRLVRGLDYYTRTTFEFFPAGQDGQQDALGGGGRYDGLIELLGGRPTPGIGFGLGLDRVVLALAPAASTAARPAARVHGRGRCRSGRHRDPIAHRDRAAGGRAVGARRAGPAEAGQAARERRSGRRPLRGHLRRRARARARCSLRDLQAGTQRPVALAELTRELARSEAQHRHGAGGR